MKYFLIPVISLGLVLSLSFGITYNCTGPEVFPVFYGSPFIFMRTSLGSSMEYFYSISGLFLNVIIWSILLIIMRSGILRLATRASRKNIYIVPYKIVSGLLLLFAILHISIALLTLGRGFDENSTYWHWNMVKESEEWGVKCEGEWKFGM